ncbi:hypothetical protein HDU67_001112 [Dinochytrium kinnereticum]|nr:hypothetical protein HDU67_001112 [Dinochytrium kinnereticum]
MSRRGSQCPSTNGSVNNDDLPEDDFTEARSLLLRRQWNLERKRNYHLRKAHELQDEIRRIEEEKEALLKERFIVSQQKIVGRNKPRQAGQRDGECTHFRSLETSLFLLHRLCCSLLLIGVAFQISVPNAAEEPYFIPSEPIDVDDDATDVISVHSCPGSPIFTKPDTAGSLNLIYGYSDPTESKDDQRTLSNCGDLGYESSHAVKNPIPEVTHPIRYVVHPGVSLSLIPKLDHNVLRNRVASRALNSVASDIIDVDDEAPVLVNSQEVIDVDTPCSSDTDSHYSDLDQPNDRQQATAQACMCEDQEVYKRLTTQNPSSPATPYFSPGHNQEAAHSNVIEQPPEDLRGRMSSPYQSHISSPTAPFLSPDHTSTLGYPESPNQGPRLFDAPHNDDERRELRDEITIPPVTASNVFLAGLMAIQEDSDMEGVEVESGTESASSASSGGFGGDQPTRRGKPLFIILCRLSFCENDESNRKIIRFEVIPKVARASLDREEHFEGLR